MQPTIHMCQETTNSNYANDIAIMDGIIQAKISRAGTTQFLSDTKIINANVVRTYLRVHHLSEILDEDGNIDEDYFQVRKRKESTYVYPYQVEPSEQAKSDWRHVIRSAFIYGDRGINRMLVLKETEPVSVQITDPLQGQ